MDVTSVLMAVIAVAVSVGFFAYSRVEVARIRNQRQAAEVLNSQTPSHDSGEHSVIFYNSDFATSASVRKLARSLNRLVVLKGGEAVPSGLFALRDIDLVGGLRDPMPSGHEGVSRRDWALTTSHALMDFLDDASFQSTAGVDVRPHEFVRHFEEHADARSDTAASAEVHR